MNARMPAAPVDAWSGLGFQVFSFKFPVSSLGFCSSLVLGERCCSAHLSFSSLALGERCYIDTSLSAVVALEKTKTAQSHCIPRGHWWCCDRRRQRAAVVVAVE